MNDIAFRAEMPCCSSLCECSFQALVGILLGYALVHLISPVWWEVGIVQVNRLADMTRAGETWHQRCREVVFCVVTKLCPQCPLRTEIKMKLKLLALSPSHLSIAVTAASLR